MLAVLFKVIMGWLAHKALDRIFRREEKVMAGNMWTCSHGHRNIQGNLFCPRCAEARPVTPAAVVTPVTPAAPAPPTPAPATPADPVPPIDPALVERLRKQILDEEETKRQIERIAEESRQQAQQPAPIVHPHPTPAQTQDLLKKAWKWWITH